MITYQNASRRPAAFNSMFGFSVIAFDALYDEFAPAYQTRLTQAEVTRKTGRPRQRKPGAGRRFKHALRDRLLLALFWLRVYPTLEVLGFFFTLDKTSAEDNLKDILATLETMTSFALEHPDKNRKKLRSVQAVMDAFPDVTLVLDAKEQRIQRPKNKKKAVPSDATDGSDALPEPQEDVQKPYYSGKKKCHTLKTQIGVRPDGWIVAVSDSVPGGATHDITLLRQTALLDRLEPDEAAMMDKGYDGITNDYPAQTLYLPYKARRGHPLTEEQKAYNRHLSKYRIVVEHTNAQLNVFQVLVHTYRHGREKHGQIVRIVAGLVNRRIANKPLKTYPVI
jgi:transposase